MSEELQEAKACKEFEARLEDALGRGVELQASAETVGVLRDTELATHVEKCAGCREAFRAAREAQALLQSGLEATGGAHPALLTRVMAVIREKETAPGMGSELWRPIELLARRLVWSAALALLVMGAYELGVLNERTRTEMTSTNELREIFPDPNRLPLDEDEVVERLAGNGNGNGRPNSR